MGNFVFLSIGEVPHLISGQTVVIASLLYFLTSLDISRLTLDKGSKPNQTAMLSSSDDEAQKTKMLSSDDDDEGGNATKKLGLFFFL